MHPFQISPDLCGLADVVSGDVQNSFSLSFLSVSASLIIVTCSYMTRTIYESGFSRQGGVSIKSPSSEEVKTRCLHHHPAGFSCRFRLNTSLISAVNPFLSHLYLPVCILWLVSIITHPTAALSLHLDVASQQIGSKQAVTGNQRPSSGSGQCSCLNTWMKSSQELVLLS